KTDAMSGGVMVASFHPRSTHPAQHNPDFHVQRAPFAAFAFRKMVVHDILFLGTNRRAFAFYHASFSHLHAQGLVSDDYGYAGAFAEAVKRLGTGGAATWVLWPCTPFGESPAGWPAPLGNTMPTRWPSSGAWRGCAWDAGSVWTRPCSWECSTRACRLGAL